MSATYFQPWLEFLEPRQKNFFDFVFAELARLEFELENPDAIDGGYRLSFRRGDSWVIADRYASFQVTGERPGISLYDESEECEFSVCARSPVRLALNAITYLS